MARLLRASEVGEYVYCHRAWWLRAVEGLDPTNAAVLQAGTARHQRHARRVATSRALLIAGMLALVLGLAALVLS